MQLGCTVELWDNPMPVLAIKNKQIKWYQCPVTTMTVSCFSSSHLLRSQWFWVPHIPHVQTIHRDWALGKVLGWSTHCLTFQSVYTTADRSLPKLSNVPTEYMDLHEVEAFLCQFITSMTVPSTYSQGPRLPPVVCTPYQAAADILPSSISMRTEQQK